MKNSLALAGVVIKEMYRRKDFYVLFILTALMTLGMGSITFFNDDHTARYVKEVCLLLIWISTLVIAISTAARQIPSEKENRTIFPLLAKPVSRLEVIVGKFLGCWFACGLTLVCFYVFFVIISGAREHSWPLATYFQALWLHWMMLAVVIAMVLWGSVVFAAPSSNGTICFVVALGILFLGRYLNKVALKMEPVTGTIVYGIYYAIPHLEFYDVRDRIIHDQPSIDWLMWGLATPYALFYTAFFLAGAWVSFRRKALNT